MIQVRGVTQRYGDVLAVDDLSIVLGLDRPTAGEALVGGRPFASYDEPMRQVGSLLDPGAMHPGGRQHLKVAARSNGLSMPRVEEMIAEVGLEKATGRRI